MFFLDGRRLNGCTSPTHLPGDRAFGRQFFLAAIPKLLQDLLGFVGPFASTYIIEWLSMESPFWIGLVWAFALLLAPFLQTVFVNTYFKITFNTGMHVRVLSAFRAFEGAPT